MGDTQKHRESFLRESEAVGRGTCSRTGISRGRLHVTCQLLALVHASTLPANRVDGPD